MRAEKQNHEVISPSGEPPLCVDLDGTLILSDLLIESTLVLLKSNPLFLFLIPIWLLRGKAFFKDAVARRVALDVTLLPYHERFVEYLRAERSRGRRLILVTAANQKYARQVADHLGVFDEVWASNTHVNFSASRKNERLCARFGARGFDYAANGRVDIVVWAQARNAILVAPHLGVERAARQTANVESIFEVPDTGVADYMHALRPHQWLKNLLIFVPLMAAHQAHDFAVVMPVLLGFLAFCLCASSVYVVNDLLDLAADRQHARKRTRPFAAGRVSLGYGFFIAPLLFLSALGVGALVSWVFDLLLCVYIVSTLAYSMRLKRVVLLDVIVLAALYTLRLFAGGIAAAVPLSYWLLAFSMFLFLSLAIVKRYSELAQLGTGAIMPGRGYRHDDLETLSSIGTSSGFLAVLVLALYINSKDVVALYRSPEILWLLLPIMIYWVARVWLLTRRGEMHDDPVIFALSDRVSLAMGALCALVIWWAV